MTDADREALIDRMVQNRLATDPAYRNAENAEEQAQREEEIVAEVERELEHRAWRATVLNAARI